jgi:hypothetical protein
MLPSRAQPQKGRPGIHPRQSQTANVRRALAPEACFSPAHRSLFHGVTILVIVLLPSSLWLPSQTHVIATRFTAVVLAPNSLLLNERIGDLASIEIWLWRDSIEVLRMPPFAKNTNEFTLKPAQLEANKWFEACRDQQRKARRESDSSGTAPPLDRG